MAQDERSFDEFTRARLPHLLRLARALTCDESEAAALLEQCLAPVLDRWDGSSPFTAEEEVRRAMVRHALRHPPTRRPTDQPVWESLADLTPRERAAVALRLHEDLTDEEAADVMDCSTAAARAAAESAIARVDPMSLRDAFLEPVQPDESVIPQVRRLAAVRRRKRRQVTAALALVAVLGLGVVVAATAGGSGATGLTQPVLVMDAARPGTVWAMTRDDECARCTVLWRGDGSADGWDAVYTFDLAATRGQLRMAPNNRDGFAWFASDYLLATHDGGRSWVVPEIDTSGYQVHVEIAGPRAWAFLHGPDDSALFSSELGSDEWEGASVPHGTVSTLVPLGDEVLWLDHNDPIASFLAPVEDPASRFLVPCSERAVEPADTALWTTCPIEGGQRLLRSTDGGRSWSEVAEVLRAPPRIFPVSDEAVFVVTFDGAAIASREDQQEVDLGLGPDDTVVDVIFPSGDTGYLRSYGGQVLRSEDGGLTWEQVT